MELLLRIQRLLDKTRAVDFLAPLAMRLYLVPVFWMAGSQKMANFSSTAEWFGNPDWGLGLPFPSLMAFLATSTEVVGAIALLFGVGVRLVAIPLMFTMVVAMATVHWQNGWLAIAEASGPFATERTVGAMERLERAKEILQQYGNYEWLTSNGEFVILNNGVEFAVTYLIMLLALFFMGGGKYVSIDYYVDRRLKALS